MIRVAWRALGVAYAAAWAIAGWLWTGPLNDLDNFFLPAVQIVLNGHPLLIYMVRYQGIIANDNGPLGLVPLTPVAAVLAQLGWQDDPRLRRMLVLGVFAIFSLLMARESVAAIDRLRGASLAGPSRLLTYGAFAASPTLWNSVLGYGHIEQPMTLWLILVAVRWTAKDRSIVAGVGFGLAILTRTLAALPLIPLALLLLVRGRWRALAWLGASAVLVLALGLSPFLLADPGNTVYSLLTHRASLPVGGGSIWQLLVQTPFLWIPQRADILFVLGSAALLSLLVLVARHDLEPASPDIYGLLALTALTLPLLAKSVWPYYFLDAYVFGAIWWLGRPRPLAVGRSMMAAAVPLIATVGTFLTEYEMGSTARPVRLGEGVAMGMVIGILVVLLAISLRSPQERAPSLR